MFRNFKSSLYSDLSPLTDLENLKNTLNEHGVAVLPSLISEKECNDFIEGIRSYLDKIYSIKEPDDYQKLGPIEGGIIHGYGLTLTNEILDLKTDERIIKPFQVIWNEQKVVTSLDGMFIGVPPNQTSLQNLYADFQGVWFHTDQASHRKEFCCIQGAINLETIEHGDGCLSVLANSHKYHREFFETFKIDTDGRDWYVLENEELEWFISKGCKWKMIVAPKGSLILWDSRTMQMDTLPRIDRQFKDRWRFDVFVCYVPKNLQSEDDVELKKLVYIKNRCTSHWPYDVTITHNVCSSKGIPDTKINNFENLTDRHKKYIFGIE